MLILAVDTSTRVGSLAVLRNQNLLGEIASRSDEHYSSRLFQDLDRLLAQLDVSLQQIDLFAVTAGPGSFTGLRVGLTAVKAWAEAGGKSVAAISGLEAVAAQVAAPSGRLVAAVIDARRGQVFGGLYESAVLDFAGREEIVLKRVGDDVVVSPDEFLSMVARQMKDTIPLFASPTPDVIQAALASSALRITQVEKVSGVLAPVIGRLGHGMALRGEVMDALDLGANYVRRTDAEVNWKGA